MIGFGTAERVLGIGGLTLCLALVPFLDSGTPEQPSVAAAPVPSQVRAPTARAATVPAAPAPAGAGRCRDLGSDGKRIEALYVHSERQRRFRFKEKVFQNWLEQIDGAFVRAAKRTGGGVRHPRFVRDQQCRTVVKDVTVDQAALKDVDAVTAAIKAQGYQRSDRKYVVWYDAPGCGLAFGIGGNDRPEWFNLHNFGPHYATIGTSCWGWAPTLHELLHTLGAVQPSAPHATKNGHCWDDEDVMCYDDDGLPKGGLKVICTKQKGDDIVGNQIDCNGDDYFHTRPPAGSYLATHWNVADSDFLSRQ
jgi:hypothetical protein